MVGVDGVLRARGSERKLVASLWQAERDERRKMAAAKAQQRQQPGSSSSDGSPFRGHLSYHRFSKSIPNMKMDMGAYIRFWAPLW